MTLRAAFAVLVTGTVVAFGAELRAEPPEQAIPTPIEQALIERACSMPGAAGLDSDKHDECLHERLSALRADFGSGLSRLSTTERRKIDSACGQTSPSQGRDGYVDCLASQMVIMRSRWSPARLAASNAAFDQSLKSRDPTWGLRDRDAVVAVAKSEGLALTRRIEMPANNLMLLFRRV